MWRLLCRSNGKIYYYWVHKYDQAFCPPLLPCCSASWLPWSSFWQKLHPYFYSFSLSLPSHKHQSCCVICEAWKCFPRSTMRKERMRGGEGVDDDNNFCTKNSSSFFSPPVHFYVHWIHVWLHVLPPRNRTLKHTASLKGQRLFLSPCVFSFSVTFWLLLIYHNHHQHQRAYLDSAMSGREENWEEGWVKAMSRVIEQPPGIHPESGPWISHDCTDKQSEGVLWIALNHRFASKC